MPSFFPLKGGFRAVIRRKGHRHISKWHPTLREAERWARSIEAAIDERRHLSPSKMTLGSLIERYREDMPRMGRSKSATLRSFEETLGSIAIADLTPDRLRSWGRERGVSKATISVDLSILSSLLRYAAAVWKIPLINPVPDARLALKHAGLVGRSRRRDRRPTEREIEALCSWFDERSSLPMRDIILFAIHTTMRASEIESLLWSDLDRKSRTIVVRNRKHPQEKIGNDQIVPLLDSAFSIIERQPKTEERIFPYNSKTWSSIFPRACRAIGIEDLRFHDLRHEGISRLFEMGYAIQEVALFSGHRSWEQLRRYTQIRAAGLRRLG